MKQTKKVKMSVSFLSSIYLIEHVIPERNKKQLKEKRSSPEKLEDTKLLKR